jgi:hypothetical protein
MYGPSSNVRATLPGILQARMLTLYGTVPILGLGTDEVFSPEGVWLASHAGPY